MHFSGYISEHSQGNGGDGNVYSACFWGCPPKFDNGNIFFQWVNEAKDLGIKGLSHSQVYP